MCPLLPPSHPMGNQAAQTAKQYVIQIRLIARVTNDNAVNSDSFAMSTKETLKIDTVDCRQGSCLLNDTTTLATLFAPLAALLGETLHATDTTSPKTLNRGAEGEGTLRADDTNGL